MDRNDIIVINAVKSGAIDPDAVTYVFKMADGRFIGYNDTSEESARRYAKFMSHEVVELVRIEPILYNGKTARNIVNSYLEKEQN